MTKAQSEGGEVLHVNINATDSMCSSLMLAAGVDWDTSKFTHLGDVSPRTTEINECYINEIGAVAHGHGLLFKRVLRTHRYDLS